MLYTRVNNVNSLFPLDNGLDIAGINSVASDGTTSVTLCGPAKAIEDWLAKDKKAVRIPSDHPWHHSAYGDIPPSFLPMSSGHGAATGCKLVTATAGGHVGWTPLSVGPRAKMIQMNAWPRYLLVIAVTEQQIGNRSRHSAYSDSLTNCE